MAALQVRLVLGREARLDSERRVPAIGDLRERRIERRAIGGNGLRQGIAEVLVLAAAEAVARHYHAATEESVVLVERGERAALRRRKQALDDGAAALVEIDAHFFPVDFHPAYSFGRQVAHGR